MTLTERLYSWALRMYPAAFREEHGEEMLATVAERRDAGEPMHVIRDLASLLRGGGRQRWLASTGGSPAATLRQGLAWGVLLVVIRQAGFAVDDLVRPFVNGWPDPSRPLHVLLVVGWIVTLGLLASGRRRWGLAVLTCAVCCLLYGPIRELLLDVSDPASFSLSVALRQFPPVLLPLLAAFAWPARGVRLPAWFWAPLVALAAVVPALSTTGHGAADSDILGYGVSVPNLVLAAFAVAAVVILLSASWSDPRWAVAAVLGLSQIGARALQADLGRGDLTACWLHGLVLGCVVAGVTVVMVRRARSLART
jgi:hypothetical protein